MNFGRVMYISLSPANSKLVLFTKYNMTLDFKVDEDQISSINDTNSQEY